MSREYPTKTSALKSWRANQNNVLKRYDFLVHIFPDGLHEQSLQKDIGPMPAIESWHVINVSVPDHGFGKKSLIYGSDIARSFPVMDETSFDFKIEMVEDGKATVRKFIEWLKKRVMTQRGEYRGADVSKINSIVVELFDNEGIPVIRYTFTDSFFMKADPVSFDYNESSKLTYLLNFTTNDLQIDFPQDTTNNE